MKSTFFTAAALVASTLAVPTNEIAELKRSIIKRQSVTSGVTGKFSTPLHSHQP